MFRLLSILLISFVSLFASLSPLHVELNIYKNISFITKTYKPNKADTILIYTPPQVELESINIDTKGCKKEFIRLFRAESIETEKEAGLKIEISTLKSKISTLEEENRLLKSLSLKDRNIKNAQNTLKFFKSHYISNLNNLSSLKQKLEKAKKKLQEERDSRAGQRKLFKASFICDKNGEVSIKYPQYDFKIDSFYEIRGDTKRNTVDISKKIKIIQKSGEDFKNIDIVSHSNSYNHRVHPLPFFPNYIKKDKKDRFLYKKSSNITILNSSSQPITKSIYRQNLTTSEFLLKDISLPNNQEKIITLQDSKYSAIFQYDIDGYGSRLAYLKATLKSDRYYQNSRASIVLDNSLIGTANLKRTKKGENIDIYFGENQNIEIKKTLLKRYSESKFFGNKEIDTQVWQYKIVTPDTDGRKINLIDRIPISQEEEIVVEPIFDTKKAKIDKKGKVVWSFKAKPNRVKIIKFGYKITKPKSEKQ